METTTLFKNGGSQAVRIPKAFRLEGSEVFIKKVPEGLLLIPKDKHIAEMWQEWANSLAKFEEPLEIERGGEPQKRDGSDELFP